MLLNWPPPTDINQDGFVDLGDIQIMSECWLAAGLGLDADVNADESVNLVDFAKVALACE